MFTIHAGEYLVGLYLQQQLKLNVWIPAKDTGIDLLVTDGENRRTVSLQAKYGKDFLPEKSAVLRDSLRCISWFRLNRDKLNASPAEFWVFVLHGFETDEPDFVVIPTAELQQRITELHNTGTLHIYLCAKGACKNPSRDSRNASESDFCWEIRGLGDGMDRIKEGVRENPSRDFSQYLNKDGWAALTKKLTA